MAKSFESKLTDASSAETVKAAKQLLKNDALTCLWRGERGDIHATFLDRDSYARTAVRPGDPGESQCSSCGGEAGKLCEHAVAALMYCGRFNREIRPIDEGVSRYAGLKYESLDMLAAREHAAPTAQVRIEAVSAFPHVPSKWENAQLKVTLRSGGREYLGNLSNLRQLFFEKKLNIALKLEDFPLQDQQIIRFLSINAEQDHASVLLNSEQTAEFFHCLIGFDRFTREGRKLFIRGDRCEAVILRRQTENGETLSPGIRVGEALIPISRAKVVTGRAGCWIGRQGEYFFIPATLDVGWLRNFFRTGEQTATGRLSENWFVNGGFPVPVVPVKSFELRTPRCRALLGGGFDAEGRFRLRLHYLYEGASVAAGSGRLVRLGGEYALRDECAELKLERELEMFGFRREGGFLTLAETEAAGIFVDQVLARWIALRGDLCLEAPLARLCAGGRGVPPVELRCQVRERGEEGWLIRYDLTAAGTSPAFAAVAAAVRSGAMYLSGEGALARIPPELGRCIRGLGNIMRNHLPAERTFLLPFHSVPYFLHLTEDLPAARPRELAYPDAAPPLSAAPPYRFVGELRPYQREGCDWMRKMTAAGFNVILADEMGLGKTVQLLALLAATLPRGGDPALVICPASLVGNWERESRRFVPELRVAAPLGGEREAVWEHIGDYDLVIASYAAARRDAARIRRLSFHYLILDAAQHIKNPGTANAQSCKAIRAAHRLVLTGTPLENSSEDLWSIFDFLHPGMLGSFNAFRRAYADLGGDRERQADLAARVSPFMLRRTKAQVGQELPPKQERTLFCELEPAQRDLYEEVRRNGLKQLADLPEGETGGAEIFTTLLRLRQICCHPGLLPEGAGGKVPSAKFELLQELVLEHLDSGHKMLIFSQFTSMLALIVAWLDEAGIRYEYLDGATRNRQQRVDHFNRDPAVPLFLLSLKAGGTGLNLTAADTVVICDPWWNPAVELQAADRTHRIGQTRPVTMMKLLVRDSIEEKILALQERKQEVFDRVIEAGAAGAGRLSLEELRFLLS